MKMMKCEMCGGTEFTKQEGFYICDSCGLKYSAEEAKKLVVSGTVDFVKGSAEKERLLENAHTFIQLEQPYKAIELYTMVTNEYPNDYRGWYGLASVKTAGFSNVDIDFETFLEVESWMKKAITCAQGSSAYDSVTSQWSTYLTKRKVFIEKIKKEILKSEQRIDFLQKRIDELDQQSESLKNQEIHFNHSAIKVRSKKRTESNGIVQWSYLVLGFTAIVFFIMGLLPPQNYRRFLFYALLLVCAIVVIFILSNLFRKTKNAALEKKADAYNKDGSYYAKEREKINNERNKLYIESNNQKDLIRKYKSRYRI